jgi:hypothetical protein
VAATWRTVLAVMGSHTTRPSLADGSVQHATPGGVTQAPSSG